MKVLLIDNYDSFVYNLVQYVGEQGAEPLVYRNDDLTLDESKNLKPDRIIISPGPGNPIDSKYFGVSQEILTSLSKTIPTLGVCLGHQGIGHTFGGKIINSPIIMHGKTSSIYHDGKNIFRGLNNPITATRYHSLSVDRLSLPEKLIITATSEEGEIMGLRHSDYPIYGVQFHPESIMTDCGKIIIRNFLEGELND